MIQPQPRPPLFPYTTLFRSVSAPLSAPINNSNSAGGDNSNNNMGDDHMRLLLQRIDNLNETNSKLEYQIAESARSEEHTSELQSRLQLVCRLLLEKKNHRCY